MSQLEKEEALKVFKAVAALYRNFNNEGSDETKREVAKVWLWKLEKGDYRLTMKRLDQYSNDNKFPPTVADILIYPPREKFTQDYSEDYKKVMEEKSNPETAKLREEKLKKLKAAMGGVLGD